MRYIPTVDLWARGVQDAILSGALVLQPGQWCICGASNPTKCRYVYHTGRSLNVIHWQGSSASTARAFRTRINILRLRAS